MFYILSVLFLEFLFFGTCRRRSPACFVEKLRKIGAIGGVMLPLSSLLTPTVCLMLLRCFTSVLPMARSCPYIHEAATGPKLRTDSGCWDGFSSGCGG